MDSECCCTKLAMELWRMKQRVRDVWFEQVVAMACTTRQGMTFLVSRLFNFKTWKHSVASTSPGLDSPRFYPVTACDGYNVCCLLPLQPKHRKSALWREVEWLMITFFCRKLHRMSDNSYSSIECHGGHLEQVIFKKFNIVHPPCICFKKLFMHTKQQSWC
jgi:hypothetical protein